MVRLVWDGSVEQGAGSHVQLADQETDARRSTYSSSASRLSIPPADVLWELKTIQVT